MLLCLSPFVINFIYIGIKCNTLLFFLILAKRVYFYLIFGSLHLNKELGDDGKFMHRHFSSMLGYHFIIWYYYINNSKKAYF